MSLTGETRGSLVNKLTLINAVSEIFSSGNLPGVVGKVTTQSFIVFQHDVNGCGTLLCRFKTRTVCWWLFDIIPCILTTCSKQSSIVSMCHYWQSQQSTSNETLALIATDFIGGLHMGNWSAVRILDPEGVSKKLSYRWQITYKRHLFNYCRPEAMCNCHTLTYRIQ